MSIVPMPRPKVDNGYPSWSPEPMAETDFHRDLMVELIETLRQFYTGQQVYVTGNILVCYEPGNRRRHVSPDVWLARGVENYQRPNYLIWEETRGPELVIELTSASTQNEDQTTKRDLYRDVLRVREYFLFDPIGDYLDPQLQGYRLRGNAYQRIRPRNGRLPSQITGLHLEADGTQLRLWNPETQQWLPTPVEAVATERDAIAEERDALAEERDTATARAEAAVAEVERLRRLLAQQSQKPNGAN